jgi:hypothetical protein
MQNVKKFEKSLWGSTIERERRRRIKVSVAAYAYEILNDSIIDDFEYDKLCREINPEINTGNEVLDKFFREQFDPSTGYWVHQHPESYKLKEIYYRYYHDKQNYN